MLRQFGLCLMFMIIFSCSLKCMNQQNDPMNEQEREILIPQESTDQVIPICDPEVQKDLMALCLSQVICLSKERIRQNPQLVAAILCFFVFLIIVIAVVTQSTIDCRWGDQTLYTKNITYANNLTAQVNRCTHEWTYFINQTRS